MLARRELSEAQVRQRLERRGHDREAIDAAVTRLRDERAIDDRRTAEAIARSESALGRRGARGVQWRIERAGISSATARRAVDDAYGEVDADALLEASIAKQLRGRPHIADDREFQRIYRSLIRLGFDSDHVIRALQRRSIK
jgi:regulatory protein